MRRGDPGSRVWGGGPWIASARDTKAPQFYTQQCALACAYLTNFDSIQKVDDQTVAINTTFVESLFPYDMSYVLIGMPMPRSLPAPGRTGSPA